MVYVSRPVRHVRDEPRPGETITLLVRAADEGSTDEVADAVRELGGTVEAALEFDSLVVTVAHGDVAALCALDGLAAVETTDTLAMDLDGAGEDVVY